MLDRDIVDPQMEKFTEKYQENLNFRNHKILVDMADQDGGFEVETILVDRIRAMGMITKRHESGGLVSDDWIIVLKKGE